MKPRRRQVLGEVLAVFAIATFVLAVLYQLRRVPFIDRYLSVMAAVLFLYVPAAWLWRQGSDMEHYGFRLDRPGRALGAYLLAAAIVFPPFVGGYWLYLHRVCPHLPHWLVACYPVPMPSLRLPPEPLLAALGQLLVIAMPEEFFFRGFIQGKLMSVYSPAAAVLLQAVIFALGHVLVSFDPATLAVFFPGLLFGVLRLCTGSIAAGALFHASCNLLIDVLHRSWG